MANRPASISRRRPDLARLASALAVALLATGAPAFAANTSTLPSGLDDKVPDASTARIGPQALYLDILMDGVVVRPLVRFEDIGGHLSVDPAELDAIGLLLPAQAVAGAHGLVALDDIPGLGWAYNAAAQQVVLTPPASLRRANLLGYQPPPPTRISRDQGVVVDWDLYGQHTAQVSEASLGTGLRWFGPFGTIESTGVARVGRGSAGYQRLDTRWTYSDPRRMWTFTAGDFISGGLGWTRPVRLGGVQWRRDFGVRPDLITYPVPQFSANATVPSSVDLYVNNVRQYSGNVDPGPFVLNDFPRVVGAGQAMVVVTDALGRTTQTSVALYVDYQRLARGLSDFSLEAGVLRRNYGIRSADYDHRPVASGSWRYGITNDFTAETHAEYGPHLGLAGGGLAWSPLGRYGVFTGNVAQSAGHGRGQQYGVGYQWFGQRLGFDLHSQRATERFRDLGSLDEGVLPLREQDRTSLWLTVPRGSVSLTWLQYRDHGNPRSRTAGLGFNQSYHALGWSLNVFHDSRSGVGGSLSVTVPLGRDTYGELSMDRQGNNTHATATISHALPYEGGAGWQAQMRDNGDGQAQVGWRGNAGEVWGGVRRFGNDTGEFIQANGSLVLMHGATFASRRISDSFAVVSTGGVGGVPILHENRVAGRTNARGYLLLTDLRGWQRNKVAIDPDQLDAGYDVPAIERLVTPADRGGVLVPFKLDRTHNATLKLLDADGHEVEAGMRVHRGDGSEAIVGFDGALWLERYAAGDVLTWTRAGVLCTVTTPVLDTSSRSVSLHALQCPQESNP